jgi:hypothetical protein
LWTTNYKRILRHALVRTGSLRPVLALFAIVVLTSAISSRAQALPDSEAAAHLGERVTIEGVVTGTPVTLNGTQFLDFGGLYPNQDFSAEISKADAAQFHNVSDYDGKRVQVTGTMTLYHGKPELILTSPDKLKLMP